MHFGGKALTLVADVTAEADMKDAVAQTVQHFGDLSVVRKFVKGFNLGNGSALFCVRVIICTYASNEYVKNVKS